MADRNNNGEKKLQLPLDVIATHNPDIEMAVLAYMINYPDGIPTIHEVISEIGTDPGVFFRSEHQIIYQALIEMSRNNMAIDKNLLCEYLKSTHKLAEAGGEDYLKCICLSENTPSGYRAFCKYIPILKKYYHNRMLARYALETIEKIHSDGVNADELLQLYRDVEQKIITSKDIKTISGKEALQQYYNGTLEEEQTIIPTGFYEFDELVKITTGKFIVIGGRPGMGKTSFALSVVSQSIIPNQIPAVYYSLEMTTPQIIEILISHLTNTPLSQIKQAPKIKLPETFHIYKGQSASIDTIISTLKALKSEYDIKIAFIDYLQLVLPPQHRYQTRQEEIATISRLLKTFAVSEKICMFSLVQLNREPDKRDNPTPLLSDIRESGAIENDADFVGFLFRPVYYTQMLGQESYLPKDITLLAIAKNRMGRAGIQIQLSFQPEYMRFTNRRIDIEPIGTMFADIPDDLTRAKVLKVYSAIKTKTILLPTITLRDLQKHIGSSWKKAQIVDILHILEEKGFIQLEIGEKNSILIHRISKKQI